MKAVVKFKLGLDGVEYREVPEPSPKPGEVKIKVLAAGICGSDIHTYKDEYSKGRVVNMPVTLGHEFVGQICELGEGVTDRKVGDWVTAAPACYSCGECWYCKRGLITLCPSRASIGTHRNGAMAEYVVVPAKFSYKLPDSCTDIEDKKTYALAEPFCCIARGIYQRINVTPGDIVVVSGHGPMGLRAVELFKSRGAYVILSGLPMDEHRLKLGLELGADEIVTSFEDLQKAVYAKNKYGADITCDTASVAPSLENCFEIIRPNGTHLQIGVLGKAVTVDLDKLFAKEAAYVPTNSTAESTWEMGMSLLASGRFNLRPLMNMQVPLSEWKSAFDAVIRKEKYKVVLLPDNTFE